MKSKRIRVEVTQADINRGVKSLCHFCPVAIAVSRALGKPAKRECYMTLVKVGGECIYINDGEPIKSPKSVKKFVAAFDQSKKQAKPFNFYLNIPDEKLEYLKPLLPVVKTIQVKPDSPPIHFWPVAKGKK